MKSEFIKKVEEELISKLKNLNESEFHLNYKDQPIEQTLIKVRHLSIAIIEATVLVSSTKLQAEYEFYEYVEIPFNNERFQKYVEYVLENILYFLNHPNAETNKKSWFKVIKNLIYGSWKKY